MTLVPIPWKMVFMLKGHAPCCLLVPAGSLYSTIMFTLLWRHNGHDGVSNHQPHGCLLNRLFRRRSKKTSMLRVTGLCEGNSPGPVNSPHKGPVRRKMFPFDDVIMYTMKDGFHSESVMLLLFAACCLSKINNSWSPISVYTAFLSLSSDIHIERWSL